MTGERVLDLVEAMDRLRSPGGCPWDAEQTHRSLAPYAIEEAHELVEAIDSGERDHLVEELGDVLLQVAFHARLGQERAHDPFDLDDVAAAIVAKLHRRHPHVFGTDADSPALSAAEVESRWEELKRAEKPERSGVLDGIPVTLPALHTATKLASRLERTGRTPHLPAGVDDDVAALWQAAARLRTRGLDPELELARLNRAIAADADEHAPAGRPAAPDGRDGADRAAPETAHEPTHG